MLYFLTRYKHFITTCSIILFSITAIVSADVIFTAPKDIASGSVLGLSSMDAGDIDGDNLPDILAVEGGKHASGRKTFAWFKGPADTQGKWQRYDINPAAKLRSFLGSAKLADMDSDGDLDIIVSSDNHSGGKMETDILIFENPLPRSKPTNPWQGHKLNILPLPWHHVNDMEIADMDCSGKLDIIVRSLEPNKIHIFFQLSSPFKAYPSISIDTGIEQSEGLAVGRIDPDKFPDIAYTGYWLRSSDDPRRQAYTKLPIDPDYKDINQNTKEALGDIDGDGLLDIIIAPAERFRNGKDHDLAWYKNPGKDYEKGWPKHIIKSKTNNIHTVKLGDIDGDKDLDAVIGIPWKPQQVTIFYNDKGTFTKSQTLTESKGLYSGILADLGSDGDIDIIGQDTYAKKSKPWIYENMK